MALLSSREKLFQNRLGKGTCISVHFSSGKDQQTLSFLTESSAWTHLVPRSVWC